MFATDQRWLALVFIPKHTGADLDIGFLNDEPYIEEMYPGAFNLLKGASGYIYTVDGTPFHSDPRLGMLQHEFISDNPVPILSTEKVDDVWQALMETNVRLTPKWPVAQ